MSDPVTYGVIAGTGLVVVGLCVLVYVCFKILEFIASGFNH